MKEPLKILLVDDDAIVLDAIGIIIKKNYPTAIIETAQSVDETLTKIATESFDLLILDIALRKQSGLSIVRQLRSTNSTTQVLVLSSSQEDEVALSALRVGANGFVCKDKAVSTDKLIQAIEVVLSGDRYLSSVLADKLIQGSVQADDTPLSQLSTQEATVFRLIARGSSVKEISHEMGISEKTVRTYRTRMLTKLGLKSDAAVVRCAIQNDFLEGS